MKKLSIFILMSFFMTSIIAQINPTDSPYHSEGSYSVETITETEPNEDLKIFRPTSSADGPFPTILFQPGAEGSIDVNSYDLYFEHLASYGFVSIIIDNTAGGPNASLFTDAHDWIKGKANDAGHWVSDYVDLNRFVVSGHSNGGMNATDIIIDRPSEIQAIVYMASYPNPGMFGFGAQNVSNYTGKVLFLCGEEDESSMILVGATNEVAKTAHDSRFTNAECLTWTMFSGVDHGGFGDYSGDAPGTIGREAVTASIRHIFVSWMLSMFEDDDTAYDALTEASQQPNSVSEFENSCGVEHDPDQEHTVTFTVVEMFMGFFEFPIENANVSIDGQSLITDTLGQATIMLRNGTYDYTVTAEGFAEKTGTVTVNNGNRDITVVMEIDMGPGHTVRFNVTAADMPVIDAVISIPGYEDLITGFMGASINLEDGTYTFTVNAEGYNVHSGSFTVDGEDKTVNVQLYPEGHEPGDGYAITFNVRSGEGVTGGVANAEINVVGEETITTNLLGVATIYLEDGTFSFNVTAEGYNNYSGSFTVAGEDKNITVELTEVENSVDINTAKTINIYPNPVSSTLNIEAVEFNSFSIVDINGKIIKTGQLNSTINTINLDSKAKGMYFIQLNNEEKTITKQLIVK